MGAFFCKGDIFSGKGDKNSGDNPLNMANCSGNMIIICEIKKKVTKIPEKMSPFQDIIRDILSSKQKMNIMYIKA